MRKQLHPKSHVFPDHRWPCRTPCLTNRFSLTELLALFTDESVSILSLNQKMNQISTTQIFNVHPDYEAMIMESIATYH